MRVRAKEVVEDHLVGSMGSSLSHSRKVVVKRSEQHPLCMPVGQR